MVKKCEVAFSVRKNQCILLCPQQLNDLSCRILNICFDIFHYDCLQKIIANLVDNIRHVQNDELPRTLVSSGQKLFEEI